MRIALIVAAVAAVCCPALAAEKPRIEVAFVLDSTGSMGGLIEGAKQKIWSIANDFVSRKPSPDLRIGLVTYRDRGDEYITKSFELTDDIDTVYTNLRSFSAGGGGDGPESVNQALDDAVHKLHWSKGDGSLRVIFLVGDYPPHMDYKNDVKYQVSCQDAARQGIIINTIQCGTESSTTPVWQEIARLSEGQFVQLSQTGDMVAVTTPFDAQIAKLSGEVSTTVVTYGSATAQHEAMSKMAMPSASPAPAAADRATYNLRSGGKAIQGRGDLLADMKEGTVKLEAVKEADLPEDMKKLTPEQRRSYVQEQQAKRDKINTQLTELSRQRDDYIAAERKKAPANADSFDARVSQIVAEQAAKRLK